MLNVECWMLNVECWMLNVECWMLLILSLSVNGFCLFVYIITYKLNYGRISRGKQAKLKDVTPNSTSGIFPVVKKIATRISGCTIFVHPEQRWVMVFSETAIARLYLFSINVLHLLLVRHPFSISNISLWKKNPTFFL